MELCPFTLAKETKNSCSEEETNIAGVAFAKLNISVSPNFNGQARLPKLIRGPQMYNAESVAPTGDLEFGLITSDGLYEALESLNFSPLYQPFHKNVWILIAMATTMFALANTEFQFTCEYLKAFLLTAYSALMVLLAQVHVTELKKRRQHDLVQQPYKMTALTWALWLLSGQSN